MNRLYPQTMNLEELIETLQRLKRHIIAAPNGTGHDMKEGKATAYHRIATNIFNVVTLNKKYPISTKRNMIEKALINLKRSVFRLPHTNEIITLPGNPGLLKMISSWKQEEQKQTAYYLVHYEHQSSKTHGIDTAILALNFRREECCLFFLGLNVKENLSGITTATTDALSQLDAEVKVRYRGTIGTNNNECYLSFDQRAAPRHNRQSTIYARAHVLLSLPLKEKKNFDQEIVGSYAGRGQSAGMCVLKRCALRDLPLQIATADLDPAIQQLLTGRSVSSRKNGTLFDLSKHKGRLHDLEKFEGRYAAYGLINTNNKERGKLRKAPINLFADGRIEIFPAGDEAPMRGRFYYSIPANGPKPLTVCYKLNYDEDIGHHHLLVFLQLIRPGFSKLYQLGKVLGGSYSGLFSGEGKSRFPRSGRFILFQDDGITKEDAFHIPFGTEKEFAELVAQETSLLPFFAGFGDRITDNPYKMKPLLLQRILHTHTNRDVRGRDLYFEGNYFLYYPSSSRQNKEGKRLATQVYKRPVTISVSQSRVVWYDEHTDMTLDYFVGSLAMLKYTVSIRFNELIRQIADKKDEPEKVDRSLTLTYEKVRSPIDKGEAIKATILRTNWNNTPFASSALLVKVNHVFTPFNAPAFMKNFEEDTLPSNTSAYDEIKSLFTPEN